MEAWDKADKMFEVSLCGNVNTVVFDATFFVPEVRARYTKRAKDAGARVSLIFLDTPYSICLARNLLRPAYRQVSENTMEVFNKSLVRPSLEEGFDFVSFVRFEKGKTL